MKATIRADNDILLLDYAVFIHMHTHTNTHYPKVHTYTHTLMNKQYHGFHHLINTNTLSHYHTLTVNTLLCSDDDKVECSGRTRRSSRDTPVDAISRDFFIKSVISRIFVNPGTKIRIAPEIDK